MDKDKSPYAPIDTNFPSPSTSNSPYYHQSPASGHGSSAPSNNVGNSTQQGNSPYPSINTYNIINSHNPTPLYVPTHGSTNPGSPYFPSAQSGPSAAAATEKLLQKGTTDKDASYDPSGLAKNFGRFYQAYLDRSVPYRTLRWALTLLLYVAFGARIVLSNGWYIITYALGIYLLNLLIAFLSPKIDPAGRSYSDELYYGGSPNAYYDDATYYGENESALPTRSDDEFRPFIRRLPEFKFWLSTTKAVLVASFCTLFEAFNVPVFWPILVMYFFILFFVTMKRQILHMIKYRYLPFTHGKTRYNGSGSSGGGGGGKGNKN